jgi:hypothetical protein
MAQYNAARPFPAARRAFKNNDEYPTPVPLRAYLRIIQRSRYQWIIQRS